MTTQPTTSEKNRVIAEWRGHKPFTKAKYENYHNCWRLLMLCVEKIESLGYGVLIYHNGCEIDKNNQAFITIDSDTKLSATFEACYQFIEQYNKIKQ